LDHQSLQTGVHILELDNRKEAGNSVDSAEKTSKSRFGLPVKIAHFGPLRLRNIPAAVTYGNTRQQMFGIQCFAKKQGKR